MFITQILMNPPLQLTQHYALQLGDAPETRHGTSVLNPVSSFPIPYSLFPIPYSLFPVPCSLPL
ncbi:hypothetical protein PL9631_610022 [Planktothrix paucivesiculata PCC 9631]|uniref:Uncharacterized protein n=1 Tax=Planktothrix paucivesiculata PCC 9631 TaxID=671071 RepID=A0A7Z9E271_9CYAN|nr:hypothetical protein PL9631_610022 [Planktothrix paucivesiculata PCC 9631]